MSVVPAEVLMELGLAMMEGARKYGRHNYRIAGVRASVYYDAALRHLMAWWEGEDIDPDSGLPHLVKAMACLCVIRDSVVNGNWVDDRPPSLAAGWINDLNKKAGDLIDRLPNAKEPHTKYSSKWEHKQLLGPAITVTDPVLVRTIDSEVAASKEKVWTPEYQNWLETAPTCSRAEQTTDPLPSLSPHSHSHTSSDQGHTLPNLGFGHYEPGQRAQTDNACKPRAK
jgi:hypothetical protein